MSDKDYRVAVGIVRMLRVAAFGLGDSRVRASVTLPNRGWVPRTHDARQVEVGLLRTSHALTGCRTP